MTLAKQVQRLLRSFGLNVTRLPGNRFDAIGDVLARLARQGFSPTTIVDVGANRGQWASVATTVYPDVPLHVIEPQPACLPDLTAFAAARGSTEVHPVVVSRPDVREVVMAFSQEGSTGAHVLRDASGRTDAVRFATTTLDKLLGARISARDRVLLKLDVEGHELDVLAGSESVLRSVDVIVSEVMFFNVDDAGNPTLLDYATALGRYGFILYDIAALASRRRDGRLRMGDAVFVREGTPLVADDRWA